MSNPQSSLRDRVNAAMCDKVPPGWLTLPEIAKRERVGDDYVRLLVREALACRPPLMQKREFRVLWGNLVRKRAHYRYL